MVLSDIIQHISEFIWLGFYRCNRLKDEFEEIKYASINDFHFLKLSFQTVTSIKTQPDEFANVLYNIRKSHKIHILSLWSHYVSMLLLFQRHFAVIVRHFAKCILQMNIKVAFLLEKEKKMPSIMNMKKPIFRFQLSFYPITQMNFLCHKRNNREHLLIALFEMKVGCSF